MLKRIHGWGVVIVIMTAFAVWAIGQTAPPAPNGIVMPAGWENWSAISVTSRTDNNTMRVILGNETAIKAARGGHANPWPDGAILAKVAWKTTQLEAWPAANVPGDFVQVEFMLKDAKKWPDTGGWGFARWKGKDFAPYGKDAQFAMECFGCHTPMKSSDYVFTRPPMFP